MTHNVETMAYNQAEVPWHGIGTPVSNDLTPLQMMEAAGVDWSVRLEPAKVYLNGEWVKTGKSALVRESDESILDIVSDEWKPVQNQEAFEFFNGFVAAGHLQMETAGSLQNGKIVWAMAKINDGFSIFGNDRIEPYMLFTNFHKFGFATDTRIQGCRVVCNNTLDIALGSKVQRMMKISHRRQFDPEEVQIALGVVSEQMKRYKKLAKFIGSKRYKNEDIVDYFKRVFPVVSTGEAKKEISLNAKLAAEVIDSQPGAEYAEGSFWQLYNCSTYFIDHIAGRTSDTRLTSAWYGKGRDIKLNALAIAKEMAEAA